MASQLEAEMVSVMLLPLGKVALAAPAQQSRRINVSDADRSRRVWIADHLSTPVSIHVCRARGGASAWDGSMDDVLKPRRLRVTSGAPRALPRLVYLGMSSIVDDEESVVGLVVLDERAHLQHQL